MNEYRELYNAGDVLGKLSGSGQFAASPAISIAPSDLFPGGSSGPTSLGGSQIGAVLDTVYLVAGIVAVVAMIVAGIRYTTANGDSGQIQAAKNTMFYAVIGLVVIIMAAAITQFVIAGITGSSTS